MATLNKEHPVIKILMERDEIDFETAKTLVEETTEEIINDPYDAEEIMLENLGLEIDYIMDLI